MTNGYLLASKKRNIILFTPTDTTHIIQKTEILKIFILLTPSLVLSNHINSVLFGSPGISRRIQPPGPFVPLQKKERNRNWEVKKYKHNTQVKHFAQRVENCLHLHRAQHFIRGLKNHKNKMKFDNNCKWNYINRHEHLCTQQMIYGVL